MFLLALFQKSLQLSAICGDHLLLLAGCFYHYRHLVVIRYDQRLSTFKPGDCPRFRLGQLQSLLNILGLIRFQVQKNLVLGVVDDGSPVLAVFKAEEIGKVLGG